jgi:hypothetical protein
MKRLMIIIAALAAAVIAPAALAATATPFGGATVSGGILTLVSNTGDAGATNDASGATFTDTGVTTFASITTLSTEFNVTDDDCKAGSPRFQIRVLTPSGEKNVFAHLGPAPSFTGCSPNTWIASGDLTDISSPDLRFDTGQAGGSAAATYAQALALVGSMQVTGLSIVVDSGWAFADLEQTINVRNVKVNSLTFFEPQVTPPSTAGLNPSKACAKLRTDMGLVAFRAKFGTNVNGKNAFGKCVSTMATMKNDAARAAAVTRLDKAADRCTAVVKAKAKGKAKGLTKLATHVQLSLCLKTV